jgi:hypothetical protein
MYLYQDDDGMWWVLDASRADQRISGPHHSKEHAREYMDANEVFC